MTKRLFGPAGVPMYGLGLGPFGTCQHYHLPVDIAGMRCQQCQRYFACYHCHDEITEHHFVPIAKNTAQPVVLCGLCGRQLLYQEYQGGICPNCCGRFNPQCARHADHYFRE